MLSFKTMQLKEEEVCRLITACHHYQNHTGSEDMWDIYEDLIHKLHNYGDEYSPEVFQCMTTE